jgi:Phosphoinositide phospholipase C, Ca2+-dependent
MKRAAAFLIGIFLCGAVAAQKNDQKPQASAPAATAKLKLNQIQVIGSHNSYKQAIDPPLFAYLQQSNPALAEGLDYSHIGIPEQLSLGLCNLEIDIYADAKGGKYAHPKGLEWAGKSEQVKPYDPEGRMQEPGFKVFHVQEIDFRSHVFTLKECLQQLKSWSDAHPGHNPVFITMNAKDETIDKPGFTVPEKFTPEVYDQLDKAFVEHLGREKLLVPDQVRGKRSSLEQAVLSEGWPSLAAAKGKFIFILDEKGAKIDAYTQGHPGLKGRVLFANAQPGTPEAAILIMNDPVKDLDKIREMVKKGYIVRTRADANTKQARNNDKSMFEAACQSGAQIITTDYYRKSTHFPSEYVISFDKGQYFRLNPVLGKSTK